MQDIIETKEHESESRRDSMDKKPSRQGEDKAADFLLAVGVGFLINIILAAGLPQVGPFIAGLVAGVIVKIGPFRGGAAGFLAGTLGEIVSITVWVITNLIAFPGALLPYAYETTFAIITAVSAVMALSGGIIGSVVSLQQGPRIREFFVRHNISLPFLHHSSPVEITED